MVCKDEQFFSLYLEVPFEAECFSGTLRTWWENSYTQEFLLLQYIFRFGTLLPNNYFIPKKIKIQCKKILFWIFGKNLFKLKIIESCLKYMKYIHTKTLKLPCNNFLNPMKFWASINNSFLKNSARGKPNLNFLKFWHLKK